MRALSSLTLFIDVFYKSPYQMTTTTTACVPLYSPLQHIYEFKGFEGPLKHIHLIQSTALLLFQHFPSIQKLRISKG